MGKELLSITDLKKNIQPEKRYYVFGAGDYAKIVIKHCLKCGYNIVGVVVSNKQGNPDKYIGLDVLDLDSIKRNIKDLNILIAVRNAADIEVKLFGDVPMGDVFYCDSELIKSILVDYWNETKKSFGFKSELIADYPSLEPDFVVILDTEEKTPIARMHITTELEPVERITKQCCIAELRKLYGNVRYIEKANAQGIQKDAPKSCIYIAASHVDKLQSGRECSPGYQLIQVGAALTTQRIGCISDDVGDNISKYNDIYSECTAHYWISKNVEDVEYVGLNHYRRQQWIDDSFVKKMIDDDVDIVLAMPQYTGIHFKKFYLKYSDEIDWDVLTEAIKEKAPNYQASLDTFGEGVYYFPCNIMFAKKNVFDQYVTFMMDVTFRIKEIFEERGIVKKKRYMGYLTEILESVYILHHKDEMNVAYTDIVFINNK